MMEARSLASLLRHAGKAFSAAAIALSASAVSRFVTLAIISSVAGLLTAKVFLELTQLPLIKASSLKRLESFN